MPISWKIVIILITSGLVIYLLGEGFHLWPEAIWTMGLICFIAVIFAVIAAQNESKRGLFGFIAGIIGVGIGVIYYQMISQPSLSEYGVAGMAVWCAVVYGLIIGFIPIEKSEKNHNHNTIPVQSLI